MTGWKLQRLIAGVSRVEVVHRAGITVAQLASIEKGVRNPAADEGKRLIGVLNRANSVQGKKVEERY